MRRPDVVSSGEARDRGPDLVRARAMVLVVVLHGLMPGVSGFGPAWWAETAAVCAAKACIPLFLLLNGYLMANAPTVPLGDFYRRRFGRLLPVVLFAYATAVAWRLSRGEPLATIFTPRLLAGEAPYFHLWFLVLMLPLTVATPWLVTLARGLDKAGWTALAATLALAQIWPTASRLATGASVPDSYFASLGYAAVVVIGAGIRLHWAKLRPLADKLAWPLLALLLIELVAVRFLTTQPQVRAEALLGFLRPNMILQGALMFVILIRLGERAAAVGLRLPRHIPNPALVATGVYVVHPYFLELGWRSWPRFGEYIWGSWAILLGTLVAATLACSSLRRVPGLRRVLS